MFRLTHFFVVFCVLDLAVEESGHIYIIIIVIVFMGVHSKQILQLVLVEPVLEAVHVLIVGKLRVLATLAMSLPLVQHGELIQLVLLFF
jgi:hypothetical protein